MTVWYAQNNNDDIESANMWGDDPVSPSNYLTWTGSHGGDTFEANGNTIFVTAPFTAYQLLTVSGGTFSVDVSSANVTITADVGSTSCTTTCVTINIVGAYLLTVVGDVTGGSGSGDYGLNPSSDNTYAITGNVYGGANSLAHGAYFTAYGGTSTITGNVVAQTSPAVKAASASTLTINGDAIAANGRVAIDVYSGGYTVFFGGSLISAADGTFPASASSAGVRFKLTNSASGETISMRDDSLNELVYKVPDYPAEAEVEDGVTFDYSTKTGTYDPMAAAVFPAAADVWHDTGAYGPNGSDYTPAMVGSDIANLEAGNVKNGVTIDDVTGTYEGGGGGGGSSPRFGDRTGGK